MKITPLTYNQNQTKTNFKGAPAQVEKHSKEVMDAISSSISESFGDVLPKAGKNEKQLGPVYNALTEKIADFVGWISTKKVPKKLVEGLNHFKKPSARMADLASFTITYFYVNNTRKSKKLDEERKMPLMINNVAVTVVSSAMAAIIDKVSDVFIDRVQGAFYQKKGADVLDNVIKKVPALAQKGEEELQEIGKTILESKEFKSKLKDYTKRVEKAKSLTVFSFVVRFAVTVLMVPVAGKIVQMVKNSGKKEPDKNNSNATEKKPQEKK